ncbi:MAG: hypothetical protein HYV07_18090 [Deltaproteobacteria bacterium]|nr:hypothetical protein [Deltaproteobacteria bacterium]
MTLTLGTRSALAQNPVSWTNCNLTQYDFNGSSLRDYDKTPNSAQDDTFGYAVFGAEIDIASGLDQPVGTSQGTCNPEINSPTDPNQRCGQLASAFSAYYNGGTSGPTTFSDDVACMRLRVDASPMAPNDVDVSASHWNFLLDVIKLDDGTPLTGTLTFTNGTTNVTGTGTLFTTEVTTLSRIKVDYEQETRWVSVASIVSATQLTLESNYAGTTAAGVKALLVEPTTPTGTFTFTNGSATVTGSGTLFTSQLTANSQIRLGTDADSVLGTIASIESATSLTLSAVYGGSSNSGSATAFVAAKDGWKEFWLDLSGSAGGGFQKFLQVHYQDNASHQVTGDEKFPCTWDLESDASSNPDAWNIVNNGDGTATMSEDNTNKFDVTWAGRIVTITNATNAANNGRYSISAATAGSITYNNAAAVNVTSDGTLDWTVHDVSLCTSGDATCEAVASRVRIIDTNNGFGSTDDEYFVDVQVPVSCIKDAASGNQVVTDQVGYQIFFSTCDSGTDPLQKDFMQSCLLPTSRKGTGTVCNNNGTSCSTGNGCFCQCEDGGTTVPVSLATFTSKRIGSQTSFNWTTATEAGNAGFQLMGWNEEGAVYQSDFIPSRSSSSTEPQSYKVALPRFFASHVHLVEISTTGERKQHGPFLVGETYGASADRTIFAWESAASAESSALVATSREAELLVTQTGVHRVTYEQLLAAGIDLTNVGKSKIAVTSRKGPEPVFVGGASYFGPGSWIEFLGEGVDSLYTNANVYWIVLDKNLVRRLPTRLDAITLPLQTSYLHTSAHEVETNYSISAPGPDPWWMSELIATPTVPAISSYTLNVADLLAGAETLRVSAYGGSDLPGDLDHHYVVRVNGVLVGEDKFDGLAESNLELALPAGLVHDGANTVEITVPGDTGEVFDLVNIDRIELGHRRRNVATDSVFHGELDRSGELLFPGTLATKPIVLARDASGAVSRITKIAMKKLLTGTSVQVGVAGHLEIFAATNASALVPTIRPLLLKPLPTGAIDYLAISHPAFQSGLASLIAKHESDGLTVGVTDVDAIYQHFSHGVIDPEAIRSYLTYARSTHGIQNVLLVGGDTTDPLNHLGIGSISYIPTLYTRTGAIVTFAPSDGLLADLDGDSVEDVAIGRLPVRTLAELDAVVAKILSYGSRPADSALFVADAKDEGNDYAAGLEGLSAIVPATWTLDRAYIDVLGKTGARTQALASMNAGPSVVAYFGHSGPTRWTFSGLFSAADARALTNVNDYGVYLQLGCWNTYFVSPTGSSLGHALLLSPNKGAAAVLGSATLTEARSDMMLGPPLLTRLLSGAPLGEAIRQTKADLARLDSPPLDVIRGFALLGDPAMRIQ